MRKATVAAVAVLALALAGVALASFQQFSKITMTATKSGQSTGFKANVYSKTTPGQKPRIAKMLTVTFPTGTKFNIGAVKGCTLTDDQIIKQGKNCPANTQVGSGNSVAIAYPLTSPIKGAVKAYAHGAKEMILVVKVTNPAPVTLVIHETASGNKLTIPIPTPKFGSLQVILTSLTLNVPSHGSGKKAMAIAGKCVNKKFTVKSHFLYTTGKPIDVTSSSACKS